MNTTIDQANGTRRVVSAMRPTKKLNAAPSSKLVPAPPAQELQFFTTTPDLSFEDALAHASSVLRCAAVAAQTAGDQLDGPSRTLVLSVMYLMDMASVMVDRSLECVQPH